MNQIDSTPSFMRRRVLLFACSLSMITYLDRVCFGVAGPFLVESLGLRDVSDLKGAFTAFALSYAIFEIPTGWLGDRWGAKRTLARIVLWWSVFTILTGMVGLSMGGITLGGLGTLVAIRFLFGAGEAGAYPNITRAVHDWFAPEQWARVQGLVWMSGRLMGGLTPLIWMLLVPSIGSDRWSLTWRGAFVLFGMIGIVWCVLFWILFRDKPEGNANIRRRLVDLSEREGRGVELDAHGTEWRVLLASRELWVLSAAYFLINYGWYFNITYLPSFLHDRFDVRGDSVGTALLKGGPLWVGAIGCVFGGRLSDGLSRWLGNRHRARCVLATGSLALAGLAWWGAMSAGNAILFFGWASLAAFCTDLTLGATWATCQEIGGRHPAVASAMMNTVGTIGAAAAGWFTGKLIDVGPAIALQADADWVEIVTFRAGYPSVFFSYFLSYGLAASAWVLLGRRRTMLRHVDDA